MASSSKHRRFKLTGLAIAIAVGLFVSLGATPRLLQPFIPLALRNPAVRTAEAEVRKREGWSWTYGEVFHSNDDGSVQVLVRKRQSILRYSMSHRYVTVQNGAVIDYTVGW